MRDKALFNVAASSFIIAVTMAGCSGANVIARGDGSKVEKMAVAQASEAEKAIAKRDAGRAITIAEAAVAADPENASWRTLLGRAYLLAGRYASAQTAFSDALTLGSQDPRTIVNLALVQTAQGNAADARNILASHIGALSAADYGLAMTMVGDPDEAIRILSQAIHDPGATAKERQNLAYAYAVAGNWTEARQMASFDLNPAEAAKRVASWAQTAQSGAESRRVIAMIGVSPRTDDGGLPVRLALGPKTDNSVQMADASTLDVRDAGPSSSDTAALSMIAAATQDDVSDGPLSQRFASSNAEVRAVAYADKPDEPFLRPASDMVAKTAVAVSRPAMGWRPVDPAKGSAWVVQLGSFSTRSAAQASRSVFIHKHHKLQRFPMIDSSVSLNGRAYYRVAIAGFGNRAGAADFCSTIKANGGSCFVRMGGSEAAPSRWAAALKSMKSLQLASRS